MPVKSIAPGQLMIRSGIDDCSVQVPKHRFLPICWNINLHIILPDLLVWENIVLKHLITGKTNYLKTPRPTFWFDKIELPGKQVIC
jgi:hypothetical protein